MEITLYFVSVCVTYGRMKLAVQEPCLATGKKVDNQIYTLYSMCEVDTGIENRI